MYKYLPTYTHYRHLKLITLAFFVLLSTLSTTPGWAKNKLTPYFQADHFAECFAKATLNKFNIAEIHKKMKPYNENLEQEVVIYELDTKSPFYHFEYLQSFSLVDEKYFSKSKNEILLHQLINFYEDSPSEKVITVDDFIAQKSKRQDYSTLIRASFHPNRVKIHRASNALVSWLLSREKHSVEHWELIVKGMELFNYDPITALGIVREIFYEEAVHLNALGRKREDQALLGSRMKPIFLEKFHDKIGSNYHFWHYLSWKLQLRGKLNLIDVMSYLFERADPSDYFSDRMGLDAGWLTHVYIQRSIDISDNQKLLCPLD